MVTEGVVLDFTDRAPGTEIGRAELESEADRRGLRAGDSVVSMYHDQGHIPLKMLGFDGSGGVSGVNVTIGLPIVRTSVDHGTAFDIAGEGVASETSMGDAIRVAATTVENRRAGGK